MNGESLRVVTAYFFAGAVLVGCTTGCGGGPVSQPTWHIAEAELRRAAAAGYPARVVLETDDEAAARAQSETLLVVGARTVRVIPAPRFEVFTNGGFEEYLFRVWVAPYLAASDLDGAVRATARGYTRALRDQNVMPRGAPLPPVPDPNAWGFLYPSRNVDWGAAVSGLALALCVLLYRISARRTGRTAPPSAPPA